MNKEIQFHATLGTEPWEKHIKEPDSRFIISQQLPLSTRVYNNLPQQWFWLHFEKEKEREKNGGSTWCYIACYPA